MPELPEVEYGRKLAAAACVGRRIERVRCARDTIVIDGVSARRVTQALTGREVVGSGRHGKHLWLELDQRPWPVFHFGMTGAFRVRGDDPLVLAASPRPTAAWPPRFAKIHLWLDDGGELVMTNARRLGRIRLRNDPRTEPPICDLGFDPLHDLPSAAAFRAALGKRRVTLKGLLLDQSFAAGVGNWIADEVLFQAKLDPRRTVDALAPPEVQRLRRCLGRVVRLAVDADARSERFPKAWLFHRRWGKKADATTTGGDRIEHVTVAGRTTAWVPAVQG